MSWRLEYFRFPYLFRFKDYGMYRSEVVILESENFQYDCLTAISQIHFLRGRMVCTITVATRTRLHGHSLDSSHVARCLCNRLEIAGL